MATHRTGIKNIQLPIQVLQKNGAVQNTIACISLQVQMPDISKPAGVDRFISLLNQYINEMNPRAFRQLLQDVQKSLGAENAWIEMRFPYYLEKAAPVSGTRSLMEYQLIFSGDSQTNDDFILTVQVPVTTLCPCSKEISDAGAHNQRAEVTLKARFNKLVWAEELIELIEESGSCELFALLKRPDEKYVTERAYQNPMFVEDVVRKVAVKAINHPHISWFSVGAESFESIHKHSAYAYVESTDIVNEKKTHA